MARAAINFMTITPTKPDQSDHLRLRGFFPRQFIEAFLQRSIENRDRATNLIGRDSKRRRNPPHRTPLRPPPNIHAQAVLKAFPSRERAKLMCRSPTVAVLHEFDPKQKSEPANVTDLFVFLLK